jgi:hypothetical protein
MDRSRQKLKPLPRSGLPRKTLSRTQTPVFHLRQRKRLRQRQQLRKRKRQFHETHLSAARPEKTQSQKQRKRTQLPRPAQISPSHRIPLDLLHQTKIVSHGRLLQQHDRTQRTTKQAQTFELETVQAEKERGDRLTRPVHEDIRRMQREKVHLLRLRKAHERAERKEQVQLLFTERGHGSDNVELPKRAKPPLNPPLAAEVNQQLPIVLRL